MLTTLITIAATLALATAVVASVLWWRHRRTYRQPDRPPYRPNRASRRVAATHDYERGDTDRTEVIPLPPRESDEHP